MKASLIAFSAVLGLASAQNAIVNNDCSTTVYVQSFPYDGSTPGPLTTVLSGGTFSEKFRTSGSVCFSHRPAGVTRETDKTKWTDHQDRQDQNADYASILWLFILFQPGLCVL